MDLFRDRECDIKGTTGIFNGLMEMFFILIVIVFHESLYVLKYTELFTKSKFYSIILKNKTFRKKKEIIVTLCFIFNYFLL
jgi:hypothetical protein